MTLKMVRVKFWDIINSTSGLYDVGVQFPDSGLKILREPILSKNLLRPFSRFISLPRKLPWLHKQRDREILVITVCSHLYPMLIIVTI